MLELFNHSSLKTVSVCVVYGVGESQSFPVGVRVVFLLFFVVVVVFSRVSVIIF